MIEDAYILFLKHGDFSLPSSHYFGDVLFFWWLIAWENTKNNEPGYGGSRVLGLGRYTLALKIIREIHPPGSRKRSPYLDVPGN